MKEPLTWIASSRISAIEVPLLSFLQIVVVVLSAYLLLLVLSVLKRLVALETSPRSIHGLVPRPIISWKAKEFLESKRSSS